MSVRAAVLAFFLAAALPLCAGVPEVWALRVISLYPGHTDNISALGAEDSIAALSDSDDLESLQGLPRLAARVTPEAVLAHRPDILILRSLNERANPSLLPTLRSAGVAVHVIEPPEWDGFEDYLRALADILDIDPSSGLARLARVREQAASSLQIRTKGPDGANGEQKKPLVFLEATGREIHTCSPGSWAAHLIEMCGGRNAAAAAEPLRPGSPLSPWGVERAVGLSPSLNLYLIQQGAMNASTEEEVRARPWFRVFKGTRTAFVPERYLSRPSLIGLERGAAILLELFHPGGGDGAE